jgi:signal transduction histidine kinase/CheY-like chemotaxis protein
VSQASRESFVAPTSSSGSLTAASPASSGQRAVSWILAHVAIEDRGPRWAVYGTALAAAAAATLLRILLDPVMGNRAPYGPCMIIMVFIAWRHGLGPALTTLGVGLALARFLFEEPRWTFAAISGADNAPLVISLLLGVTTALLCESLRIAARFQASLAQQAREADARKDEFLATLSHELRNPLAPVRLALYQLEHIAPNDPRAAELHAMIDRQMDYMVRLVNDLLDVSRITRGKVELQLERVSLNEVVGAAVSLVRPLMEAKEHDLRVALPPVEVFLQADPVRLTQALANLLNNAAKYTQDRGRIWLNVALDGKQAFIRVRDTGIGIAPDMLQRIFDLFQQGHAAIEYSQGGLGVGLTLARNLVEMHGGRLEVASPGVGLGSEFSIRMPIVATGAPVPAASPAAVPASSPAAVPAASPAAVPAAVPRGPLRILVVEDSVAIAQTMADVLRLWNHTVEICQDAFCALDAVPRFRPDVILTDLGLPRMNGYDLAREIHRMPGLQGLPMIAISGYGQPKDREQSKAAGFLRHLVKPIAATDLEKALAELTPAAPA